jgi:hypothetical protein
VLDPEEIRVRMQAALIETRLGISLADYPILHLLDLTPLPLARRTN